MTTFRAPWDVVDAVDRARRLIDPSMSRALFVRLAVQRVAEAINTHNDEFLRGAVNERPSDSIQPAQSD